MMKENVFGTGGMKNDFWNWKKKKSFTIMLFVYHIKFAPIRSKFQLGTVTLLSDLMRCGEGKRERDT